MGQINISRITSTASILTPPVGVDAIYNNGGSLTTINSSGATSSLLKAGITGGGNADYIAVFTGNDTIAINGTASGIKWTGTNYQSGNWAGWTSSTIMVADASGNLTDSNITIKQIAVTVSNSEVLNLFSTPKVLIPKAGTGRTHQVISAYVRVNVVSGNYATDTNLLIFEGGNGSTHQANALGTTQIRRYRFIPTNTGGSLTQTQDDDGDITLTTGTANPTGGSATLTVYLTYTTYNESLL